MAPSWSLPAEYQFRLPARLHRDNPLLGHDTRRQERSSLVLSQLSSLGPGTDTTESAVRRQRYISDNRQPARIRREAGSSTMIVGNKVCTEAHTVELVFERARIAIAAQTPDGPAGDKRRTPSVRKVGGPRLQPAGFSR